jgi:sugar lactone lactonase YvrE
MKGRPSLMLIIVSLALGGCASSSPATSASTILFPPDPTVVLLPTPTEFSTPTLVPSLTPTSTNSPIITDPKIIVLAANLPEPDDLLRAADGSIYVSDVTDGTIRRYTENTGLQAYLSGLSVPEGMVILPDASMIIVEQGKNRLVRYDPNARTLTPILILHNTTGQLGVDNIALDAHNPNAPSLIVPDSPNGTILRVSLDGQNVTQIASGFARPVDAWVEPDGSLLIVDENGNSLKRIHPDGTIEKLGVLPIPDDVIEDGQGNIFVNTLGDNAIHLISASTRQDSILIQSVLSPQGMAFDSFGNLIVTDPGNHRLIKLIIH